MTTLADIGEFGFIDAIARLAGSARARGVSVGIGDDAAVVACSVTTLLTTDTQREGVHFRLDWLSARQIGRRAFRVAVSDISAMGGSPRYLLLSLGAPAQLDTGWARRMIGGLVADAHGCGAALVGGNVSADEKVSLVLTVVADGPRCPVLRNGAKAGDRIWITGPVGAAAAGVELLRRGVRRSPLIAAYRTPPLRLSVANALSNAGVVTAMVDVSDGLVQDVSHVCRASGVAARLDVESVPMASALLRAARPLERSAHAAQRKAAHAGETATLAHDALYYALRGGEDYELVFTTSRRASEREVRTVCARHGCAAARIGEIVAAHGDDEVYDERGRALHAAGYDHYGARS